MTIKQFLAFMNADKTRWVNLAALLGMIGLGLLMATYVVIASSI